jgi:hypothetical protein
MPSLPNFSGPGNSVSEGEKERELDWMEIQKKHTTHTFVAWDGHFERLAQDGANLILLSFA